MLKTASYPSWASGSLGPGTLYEGTAEELIAAEPNLRDQIERAARLIIADWQAHVQGADRFHTVMTFCPKGAVNADNAGLVGRRREGVIWADYEHSYTIERGLPPIIQMFVEDVAPPIPAAF